MSHYKIFCKQKFCNIPRSVCLITQKSPYFYISASCKNKDKLSIKPAVPPCLILMESTLLVMPSHHLSLTQTLRLRYSASAFPFALYSPCIQTLPTGFHHPGSLYGPFCIPSLYQRFHFFTCGYYSL